MTFPQTHPEEDELFAYLDQALEPGAQTSLERHLQACAGCRRQVEAWRRLFADLAAAPETVFLLDLSPAVLAQLPRMARTPRFLPIAAALQSAIAAGLLVFAVPTVLAQPELQAWISTMNAAASAALQQLDPVNWLSPLADAVMSVPAEVHDLMRRPEALLESLIALTPLAVASSLLWLIGNTILLRRQPNGR